MAGEFEQKMGRILKVLMNKSVLDEKTRKEVEQILGNIPEDALNSIGELVSLLAEKAPYLSEEQTNALKSDLKEVFSALSAGDDLEEAIEDFKNNLDTDSFGFAIDDIPEDVVEDNSDLNDTYKKKATDVCKLIINDFFGKLIENLPSDERLRLTMNLDRAIEGELEKEFK